MFAASSTPAPPKSWDVIAVGRRLAIAIVAVTICFMSEVSPQDLCEVGQEQLMRTEYLEAETTLAAAEAAALAARDWDLVSRLYMPLQEARRQRRQRCGEGIVCLDLLSEGPHDRVRGEHVVENYPHGQLLVAGWGTIQPAIEVRRLAAEHKLYVETYLAAAYPVGSSRAVVIVPTEDVRLPEPRPMMIDELLPKLPAHSIVLGEPELPRGSRKGTYETFAQTMALWERLHAPFLAAADAQPQPLQKIDGYRKTIRVDYACELAHQKLSAVARELERMSAGSAAR